MKKKITVVGLVSLAAMLSSVNGSIITSVTALDGDGAPFTTTTTANLNDLTNAAIQSFVADGVTYLPVSAAASGASYVGTPEGILYHPGGTAPSASVAMTDLDLGTGSLDPRGDNFTAGDHFRFDNVTFALDTTFFLFNNGTPASGVYLVDTSGNQITDTLGSASYGGEVQIGGWDYSRTNGGDLNNRDVAGVTFAVRDFTFQGANGLSDVVGFQASGGATFDATDAGIAVVIPEPTTLALVGFMGIGLVAARRFRR